MIHLTFDMIPRALFVLFITHIIMFIIDIIRIKTTYKYMNSIYYWKNKSAMNALFYIDVTLCAIICAILAAKYILTGEII